jgi:arabinogalactan oligomer/maltooligosaccharide transport system permease protein
MAVVGGSSLVNMINLSTFVGDRRQPLVYGIIALIFSLYVLLLYFSSQNANLKAENALVNKRQVETFRQEVEGLKNRSAYKIMLFLPIIGAILFTIIPLIFMILLAFTNYNIATGVGINRFIWTGLDSFKKLFDGGTNFNAFVNVFNWTMVWAFFATFTTYFGGFFLALLIAKKTVKWKKLHRSLFVIAMAIPQFVSLRVMYSMFHDYGPINSIITSLGADRILFWSDVNTAKTLIILINMWVGIPYFMLLISGLLLNIPKDYYEAAEIDGAGKWAIFKKITFPYILFSTTPLLITSFVANINNFNVIWLLTNGGPMGQGTGGVAGGTDIFITWLYKLTMYNLNVAEYDIGAAIGIIMFIISSVISLVIFRNTGAYKKESEFRK